MRERSAGLYLQVQESTPALAGELSAALLEASITVALALLCAALWRRTRQSYFGWWALAFPLFVSRITVIAVFIATNDRALLFWHQVITGWTGSRSSGPQSCSRMPHHGNTATGSSSRFRCCGATSRSSTSTTSCSPQFPPWCFSPRQRSGPASCCCATAATRRAEEARCSAGPFCSGACTTWTTHFCAPVELGVRGDTTSTSSFCSRSEPEFSSW